MVLPDGEQHKNMDVIGAVWDTALELRLDRKCIFVALGGGVIGDMTGFAAASYQRGVSFLQVAVLRGSALLLVVYARSASRLRDSIVRLDSDALWHDWVQWCMAPVALSGREDCHDVTFSRQMRRPAVII